MVLFYSQKKKENENKYYKTILCYLLYRIDN